MDVHKKASITKEPIILDEEGGNCSNGCTRTRIIFLDVDPATFWIEWDQSGTYLASCGADKNVKIFDNRQQAVVAYKGLTINVL